MENDSAKKTLDTLFEVVQVNLKVPLGVARINFPVSDLAKNWWESKKRESDLEDAIQRAEQKFIAAYPDKKITQILHDFPLYSDEDNRKVIADLLTHLDEEKITWLAEIKLEHAWDKQVSIEEIRSALELYLPFLRHELNGIKEFQEIITARTIERIYKRTERIEDKLDKALKSKPKELIPAQLNTGWFFGHRYGDLAAFTGRADELKMLDEWVANDHEALLMIRALGGFGKSALAWAWFNRVDREKWPTAIWWSFYESGFESFLTDVLTHLGIETDERSSRQQVNDLLDAMQSTNILIVLDGFERLLRQYGRMAQPLQRDDERADIDRSPRDCASPLTETFLRGLFGRKMPSKVLMTTRLTPRVLESADGKLLKGCRDESLPTFSPDDAVAYFHKEGIAATRAEIIAVCSAYGYHPLSLSMLAGLILNDIENPVNILVAQELRIDNALKQRLPPIFRFKLTGEFEKFTNAQLNDMISEISKRLDIDSSQVEVLSVSRGSVQVTLELPEDAALRLFDLYLKGDPIVANLFIQKIEFSVTEKPIQSQRNTISENANIGKILSAENQQMSTSDISVFISYSHDSPQHEAYVLAFSDRLRADGINAMIDQYQAAPSEGWQIWMEKQIRDAQFVLLICTETYLRRVMKEENPGKGMGVTWESAIIYQYIYNSGAINVKFIPIIFGHNNTQHIPMPLQSTTHYDVSTNEGYELLYRFLTNQPLTPKSPLGKLKKLSPKPR